MHVTIFRIYSVLWTPPEYWVSSQTSTEKYGSLIWKKMLRAQKIKGKTSFFFPTVTFEGIWGLRFPFLTGWIILFLLSYDWLDFGSRHHRAGFGQERTKGAQLDVFFGETRRHWFDWVRDCRWVVLQRGQQGTSLFAGVCAGWTAPLPFLLSSFLFIYQETCDPLHSGFFLFPVSVMIIMIISVNDIIAAKRHVLLRFSAIAEKFYP